jgi:hypothetical protein
MKLERETPPRSRMVREVSTGWPMAEEQEGRRVVRKDSYSTTRWDRRRSREVQA